MRQLTVALDMDNTTYDLNSKWFAWLEETHGERFTSEQIESWDFHNQLECGTKVYDYLQLEDAFIDCPLLPGAKAAIDTVHAMGVRQFFVSTIVSPTGAWQKQKAIERDFPYLAKDVLITSGHKDMIRADLLVDDGPHNLEAFDYGLTCKVPTSYNGNVNTDYVLFDWSYYPTIIRNLLNESRNGKIRSV